MIPAADTGLRAWVAALAGRSPTPGGGAAAAAAAALGAATAAMAAIYTTGRRWADRADEAQALHARLLADAEACIALADQDQAAYAALQETWGRHGFDAAEVAQRQARALALPAALIDRCTEAAAACRAFAGGIAPRP